MGWGVGSSGHTSAMSPVPSPWCSFYPRAQDFWGRSPLPHPQDRQIHERMEDLRVENSGSNSFYLALAIATSPGSAWEKRSPPCPVSEAVP